MNEKKRNRFHHLRFRNVLTHTHTQTDTFIVPGDSCTIDEENNKNMRRKAI